MDKTEHFLEGVYWEPIVGYSRAVRRGNVIEISGTTATSEGEVVGLHDEYLQTKFILGKFQTIMHHFGTDLSSIVRTRIFCTDVTKWEKIAKAHEEFFGHIKPATSMYQISALINKDLLVEIEATAIIA
ncbi:MAG TPA: RidA family protein [Chitinophagales bacterium]|nr:RidA family protein [Chitinophagales bacterium]